MKVLMIIPAYNEEESIINTVKSLKKMDFKKFVLDYVVINDGSSDNTRDVCLVNNLNFIDLPINLGIGGAVQTGYKYAFINDYDIAIQFDGDGQHDAKYISHLVEEIKKGADIAIGSRYIAELSKFKSTAIRRVGIKFLSFLIKLCTGKKIYDPTSGFRASNQEIIRMFAEEYPTDFPEPDTIVTVIKNGYNVSEIPVEMNERSAGKSSISGPFKSVFYMIKVSISIIISSTTRRRKK